MTDIASFVFRQENLEFCVHGNRKKFAIIEAKLELLVNAIKNDNSRFNDKLPNIDRL